MISKRWLWVVFLFVVCSIRAQNSLSLSEVVAFALEKSNDIKKAKISVERGYQKTREVGSIAKPKVDFSANYLNNLLLPVLVVPGELTGNPGGVSTLEIGLGYNTNVGVTLDQVLFDKSVFTALKAARKSEEFFDLGLDKAKEEIAYQVALLYYQISVLDRNIEVLEANLNQTTKLLEISETRLTVGFIKQVDLDRLNVSKMNLETQLSDLRLARNNLQRQFQVLIGMPLDTGLTLVFDTLDEDDVINIVPPPLEKGNLTDFKLLNTQKKLYELETLNFKSGYYPKLSLFANYSYNGVSDDSFFSNSDVSTTWYDVSMIGLSLKLSVFDGFKKNAQISQSRLNIQQIEEELAFTNNTYDLRYAQANDQLRQNLETLSNRKSNVNLASKVYDISRESYNEGLSNLTDLLSAETALTNAELNYSSALLQIKIAEIELLKTTGNLVESLINKN